MYRGRFAPTPSGELHLGSLVTAVASYLDARASGGEWFIRIEDVDSHRSRAYFEAALLRELERHGLFWDGPIVRQSERMELYSEFVSQLFTQGAIYPCRCSKSKLKSRLCPVNADGEYIYDGHCRDRGTADFKEFYSTGITVRIKVDDEIICFHDAWQGERCSSLSRETGDFVLRRGDGCFAYNFAVVVDDHLQGVTHVVRGEDILPLTFRHIYLQNVLGFSSPHYSHIPLVYSEEGTKLSKSSSARALRESPASENLLRALSHLGVQSEFSSSQSSEQILGEALEVWKVRRVR